MDAAASTTIIKQNLYKTEEGKYWSYRGLSLTVVIHLIGKLSQNMWLNVSVQILS
jgi:hypothetical protein